MTKRKKILILFLALAAVFVVLDFNYLWFNIRSLFGLRQNGGNLPSVDLTLNTNPAASASVPVPGSSFVPYKSQPTPPPQMSGYTIAIESLNIRAPMVYVYGATEKDFQAGLINGVVHYPGTALPGEPGNCYIFGHSSDYIWSKGNYKTVFAALPKIQIGAKITVSDQTGKVYKYAVVDSREVAAKDTSVLVQDTSRKTLTLQTSYPIGTALKRWIVIAELEPF